MSLGSGGIQLMAIVTYPAKASGVKLIQRGTAGAGGTITISSVDVTKTFVRSYSISSAGTVATNSSETGVLSPSGGSCAAQGNGSNSGGSWPQYIGTRSLTGGSTSLISSEYGVYLTGSTTLQATGACRWEVIEHY